MTEGNNELGELYLNQWVNFYKGAFEILFKESEEIFNLVFINSSSGGPELATATLLYRKVVEILYGNLSLIKCNEFLLIKSFNRELFESMIYLYYVSNGDKQERLISYHVYNFLKNQKKLRTYNPYSDEFDKLTKCFSKTLGLENLKLPILNSYEIEQKIKEIDNVLQTEPYNSVFEKYYKGNRNRKWYSIDINANNFEQLAEKLKFGGWYEILYREYSEYIHSTSLNKKSIMYDINDDGCISITSVPSPPFDLVADFLYCNTFIKTIINSLCRIFENLPKGCQNNLKNRIDEYFASHQVEFESDFFDPEKKSIIAFPQNNKHF